MREKDIELEEGEAYFLQQQKKHDYDDDDDDKIPLDPDRDLNYIDKKIENYLGQYQKDFMGGLSAESLGARFGGYGSFLPTQQRSPPILSNQRSQSHVTSNSPQDLSSEHFHQNPMTAAPHSVPAKSMPASGDQNVLPMSDSRASSIINQVKIQSSGKCASNHQKKTPEKKPLKFRVKMAPENFSCVDKTAIYSGLGLDMSPSSSREASPSDIDGTSTGLQDMNLESSSFIIKIMTTMPLPNNDLLSPLHDGLVYLNGMESRLETDLPGIGETLPVDIVHEDMYSKGKKEVKKERKLKVKDANKVKKSKHREGIEEKLKKKVHRQKPVELMETSEYPANIDSLSPTRREEVGASMAKEGVSNASNIAVGAYSEEKEHASLMRKSTGSKPSFELDKRNEVGWLGEDVDNPMKQVCVARHKAKEEPGSAKKHGTTEDDKNATILRGKTDKDVDFNFTQSESSTEKRYEVGWREDKVYKFSKQDGILKDKVKDEALDSAHLKDKNVILTPKCESGTEKRNGGRRDAEANKSLKQQRMVKDKVKEEVPDSSCPTEAGVYRKENGIVEKIPNDEQVRFLSLKDEEHNKYSDVSEVMKFNNVETLDSSKQKSHSRAMTPLMAEQVLPSEKDNLSSVVKKKSKDGEIGGLSAAEPPRGSSIVSSSAAKNEGVMLQNNIPSKSKKVDTDLRREMRKDNEVAIRANPRKKGKEVSSKDCVMGVSERETQAFTTRPKDKSSNSKTSRTSNIGSNMEGDFTGVNCMTDKVPVGNVLPAENAPVLLEEWVECDKCHTWRLLPLGMSSSSLTEEKWTCSMLTWLPGMNKCSFSEDETTNALRALYVPLDPASLVQNNQAANLDANASVNMSAGASNVILPSRATTSDALPSGGKRKNLVKTEIDPARQSGSQDLHIPVKKDQRPGETRNLKNQKKFPRESDSLRKSGVGKPSKIEKKRAADVELYGVPKKMKRARQQPMEEYNPGALRAPQDLSKGSSKYPVVKAKDRSRGDMTSKDDEMYDVSGKKRKLKQHRVPSGKGEHLVNSREAGKNSGNEHRKEKSKSSNFQARESSADKTHIRAQSDDAKSTFGVAGDSSLHKGGRSEDMPLEQYHVDRVSRKTLGGRTSSDMAFDLGLSDNATTSSSSKISSKVKAKVHEVKSSPVGSTSSSPIKFSKPDPDKGPSKKSVLYNEQRPKSGVEMAANEFEPLNEVYRDRKSNLSRNSGFITDAADEDHINKKVSSGRHPISHTFDTQPKLEDCKDTGGKLDHTYEGTSTSLQKLVGEHQMTNLPNKFHFGGSNLEKGKSHSSKIDSEKEVSSNSHGIPEYEGVGGSNGGRVNNVNGKPTGQVTVGHYVSLRQSHHSGHLSNDIEASSSRKKDGFHRAAKTALKEAIDLKHSANRVKVSGSSLESTGIFFQAALKFLHGASLLEPGNSESTSGEMAPNEVYTSTAKLCEYCAFEFERCNDMASAALAYKCMEVAYMRVVYCNDLGASRDRLELQMAVRSAPQVESPSSSASDIDNLNQAAIDTVKDGHSAMDQRSHVVSAGNRPNFMRLLDFTHDINLAMEASRRSQSAFAAAMAVFTQAGNEEGITCVKRVLDFSFHDVDGLLHLVRLAMESIKP